ncbi:MAG: sulfite exporter TauE/SafE family protein [Bacteroidia bacterium]|nr:sulfite exporter TauE/SafE family protein [Bacteroidia bacterium]
MAAFLSGFLGVGGGIVYIPVIEYYLKRLGIHSDILVKTILANSLFTIIFSGSVSSYYQYKNGNFYPKQIIQTALPGIVSALLITYLIKNGTWYNKTVFNYVFASMLLLIVTRMYTSKPKVNADDNHNNKPIYFGSTGFIAGIVTAFSGLGGGVVMTPVFTDIFKQPIKKASSISNGVIPFFAISMGIYNLWDTPEQLLSKYQIGYIVLPIVIPLILSTFIFAPIGVNISQKTSHKIIRFTFASFASLVFFKLIYELFF